MNRRTIHIVDDNPEFRLSAQWWLAGAGYAVQAHGDPDSALQALSAEPNDPGTRCLLLDVRMPGMSGLDLHDALLQRGVQLPVVYMSGHADVPLAVQAMQKGAISFLEKPFADEALEAALQRAFEAGEAAAKSVPSTHAIDTAPVPSPTTPADPAAAAWQARLALLTPRERELFDWVVQDKLNKTIADLMGISIKTVELHRKRMMDKLGAASATQLMRMAVSGRTA